METGEIIKIALAVGGLIVGGGGIFGALAIVGKALIDRKGKADETYFTMQAGELVTVKAENATLRARVEKQAGEIARMAAQAILSEGTIKRLRSERNRALRIAKSLGAKLKDMGFFEVSEPDLAELAKADDASSHTGDDHE